MSAKRRASSTFAAALAVSIVALAVISAGGSLMAQAQVVPSASASPSPSTDPSPSPSESPSPTEDPTPSQSPTPVPTPSPTTHPSPPSDRRQHASGGITLRLPRDRGQRSQRRSAATRWRDWRPPTGGAYSTARLDAIAKRLRRRGWSDARLARMVYAPFPVMGPASWTDSWGAPRFDNGIYHPHQGQDVLCRYGAPVLAVEDDRAVFIWDSLGGRSIILQRPDGSYWYLAHLSAYATGVHSGDVVHQGEIIGRCGTSGDATVPHVHFAFFSATGVALDPMHALITMLHEAEARAEAINPAGRGRSASHDVPVRAPVAPEPVNVTTVAALQPAAITSPGLGPAARAELAVAMLLPLVLLPRRVRRRAAQVLASL